MNLSVPVSISKDYGISSNLSGWLICINQREKKTEKTEKREKREKREKEKTAAHRNHHLYISRFLDFSAEHIFVAGDLHPETFWFDF